MNDCIFCKIANGEIPAKVIYEDKIVKVYLDINPLATGHTLIIPKKHFTDLDDIDMETLTHIMKVAKDIKKKLEDKLGAKGIRLMQNNGVFQEVKHYHLHLIPDCDVPKKSLEEVFELLQ
jgi:histidine triad (HIT) family protein